MSRQHSRYRLYLNGKSVSVGPCKGDKYTHYYETVDVSGFLQPGINVLAALVVHYPADIHGNYPSIGPVAVWRSDRGAFLFEGELMDSNGQLLEKLHSDRQWKAQRDAALAFQQESFTLFVGGAESVDGRLLPHGWQSGGFDDSAWPQAGIVGDTHDRFWGQLTPWQLVPRPIPPLYEAESGFRRVMRSGLGTTDTGSADVAAADLLDLAGSFPMPLNGIAVPTGKHFWIELDAGAMSTGYLQLAFSGGAGAEIRMRCSECYEYPLAPGGVRNKGVRDEWLKGKALYGPTDEYRAAGIGSEDLKEMYEPFWFRTFRFVRLEVTTLVEPLIIGSFHAYIGIPAIRWM